MDGRSMSLSYRSHSLWYLVLGIYLEGSIRLVTDCRSNRKIKDLHGWLFCYAIQLEFVLYRLDLRCLGATFSFVLFCFVLLATGGSSYGCVVWPSASITCFTAVSRSVCTYTFVERLRVATNSWHRHQYLTGYFFFIMYNVGLIVIICSRHPPYLCVHTLPTSYVIE